MNVIAINGGPRKSWSTVTLLESALKGAASNGANTELIHLYDLDFKGCKSCFACKRKNYDCHGLCAINDELKDVLEKILKCDVLILGSPIYFGNVTGEMRSFMERLLFPNLSYDDGEPSTFTGHISSAFIYTMNITENQMHQTNYETIFEQYKKLLQLFNGTSETLISNDTFQFNDYSMYNASRFDAVHKASVKSEQFPLDCQKAFEFGARITSEYHI